MEPYKKYIFKKTRYVYEDRIILQKLTQFIAGLIKDYMGIKYWTSLQFVTYSRHFATFSIQDVSIVCQYFLWVYFSDLSCIRYMMIKNQAKVLSESYILM